MSNSRLISCSQLLSKCWQAVRDDSIQQFGDSIQIWQRNLDRQMQMNPMGQCGKINWIFIVVKVEMGRLRSNYKSGHCRPIVIHLFGWVQLLASDQKKNFSKFVSFLIMNGFTTAIGQSGILLVFCFSTLIKQYFKHSFSAICCAIIAGVRAVDYCALCPAHIACNNDGVGYPINGWIKRLIM